MSDLRQAPGRAVSPRSARAGRARFYEATRKARTELVQVGGDPYKAYKTRLSIALRLLWPKRAEQRSPFWRPDWRMSMVAEASVRHWSVAFRAVQEGHQLLA
ncbi:hypothetical protein ACFW93_21460, partial [Streptomyces canus]|uniref:hypothetical protein n=1 Tax=Streptomyces canus TaxID=58343 RepID=UPI0036984901